MVPRQGWLQTSPGCPISRNRERDTGPGCFGRSGRNGASSPSLPRKTVRQPSQEGAEARELDKRLLPLSKSEKALWRLDQKINDRGVYCDVPTAKKAIEIVDFERTRLDQQMRDTTSNQVSSCNAHVALKTWINGHDGMEIEGVGKDIVLALLENPDLPATVKAALEVRAEGSKNSVAKLEKMVMGADVDQRVRGCFQYYGAASTGRWAGRRIQLQNMTRPTIPQKDIEEIIQWIAGNNPEYTRKKIDMFHGAPMSRISDCLRGMLMAAPGKKLIACDFSAIEGRVLAWLAGEEKILNVFRGDGKIYEYTASQIYGVPINKITKDDPRRLIGKVATLALGYQGGVKAFQSMAKNYFVKVPEDQAEQIKVAWRERNPNIVQYWYNIERAAIGACQNPGQKFAVGPKDRQVIFLRNGSFLFCRLPSGRAICYPYPKMKVVKTPWGENKDALTYKGEDSFQNYKFVRKTAYGGLLTENVTQAVARDLLSEALFRVEAANYPVVMHVHDEAVTEVDQGFGSPRELEEIMCELPAWAKDLPVTASAWTNERYRK